MSSSISAMTARLEREVPDTELRIDDALVAMSSLMTTIVTARRDIPGVPTVEGQATIKLLANAQLALIGVSGDVLRVHGHLRRIGKETAGYDLHECPQFASPAAHQIHAVA